jgi:alpha-1,2-mannosyltransferase
VTAIAALPYALWVLVKGKFVQSLGTAVICTAILLGSTFALDSFYYGRYSLSLYSFLSYNVFGSGDSALYGVENSTYYLRNGALSLNVLLPLSFLAPLLMLWKSCISRESRSMMGSLFAACSPQWVWLAAITYLPHKEERFLYVVYPQILCGAAYCIVEMSEMVSRLFCLRKKSLQRQFKRSLILVAILCTSLLSASRVGALLWNYSAHMWVYGGLQSLDQTQLDGPCTICLGSEWYEFPSHFFVPEQCEVHFLDSGFGGILPAPFNQALGGTRYGATYLNDRNEADEMQFIGDESRCNVVVALKYDDKLAPKELNKGMREKGWEVVQEHKYVQGNLSAALYRALFIPFLSPGKLLYNYYVLYASNNK